MTDIKELIGKAAEAREHAYTPYSHYRVGAALLCADGKVYTGCNIENAAYGPSNCAERTAFFKAVSEDERNFSAIAICGGAEGESIRTGLKDFAYPCGVCRQVMREFCDPESFIIYVAKSEEEYETYLLKDLLPNSFGPDNLR